MTDAAAATTTLKVATGVCLLPQRDPIHTAKEVATVDVLSEGRVISVSDSDTARFLDDVVANSTH